MNATACSAFLALMLITPLGFASEVVLQTEHLRVTIGADARLKSVVTRRGDSELAWTAEPLPIACVYRGGQMAVDSQEAYLEHEIPAYRGGQQFPATAASLLGEILTVTFGEAKVIATYRVKTTSHYLAFELTGLQGAPIDRIDLIQLRLKRPPLLGPWINVAYDDDFAVCLCAGNIRTDAGMHRFPDYVDLATMAAKEVALEGATAVLFGCPEPKEKFLDWMEIVERDYQMPPGARNRRSPLRNYSYLWGSPTPADIDQYIALAKRAGFRMLLFSYSAFAKGAGHFEFNTRFPRGLEDLKALTGRVRGAGLAVGLHLHYSKADRTDPYVTPVPDNRLHKLRSFTLSTAIDGRAGALLVNENPAGSTLVNERRLLQIGPELIAYQNYTTQPPYRFIGCQRGYLKTSAREHQPGEQVGLLDVDDWTRFIRFDQNTDIQDEAARRIAEIANATGPYDLIYFDGAEDVHDPFWYHVANAQERVYRLLQPAPTVCEAAMSGHFSWHIITGGQAYDVVAQHIQNFCREISCRVAPVRALEFTRINFGWIFPFSSDLGPDVLEYVLSRGAAWDCPFALRLALSEVASNPRAEDCFDVIKTWEDARLSGRLSADQKSMLRTLPASEYRYVKVWDALFAKPWMAAWSKADFNDQQHHLFLNERGQYELAPFQEVPGVLDGRVKALLFQRSNEPGAVYCLLWARQGELEMALPVASERLELMRPFGTPLSLTNSTNRTRIPVGSRRYLRIGGVSVNEATAILRASR